VALILQNTVVYHAGRTGGHWVKSVLRRAGLIQAESPRLHDSPEDLRYWPEARSRPLSICFVRHPLTWVRSVWIHETQFGWSNDELRPPDEYSTFAEYLAHLVRRFPNGAVSKYFAPFIRNGTLVGKFETLETDLVELLRQSGEFVPDNAVIPRAINRSALDVVASSARAPRDVIERFLESEAEFCGRFGYEGLPGICVANPGSSPVKWFPALSAPSPAVIPEENVMPDNTFVFSDGSVWRGKDECRRAQLAFWDALYRGNRNGDSGFLELYCGDGYFVFLAEELGYKFPRGAGPAPRATTAAAAARLHGTAQFLYAPMFTGLEGHRASTILIREVLNHTPWPHLLLIYAKQMLAQDGEIVIGSVVFEPDVDPGLCLSNSPAAPLFPVTCPLIMSRAFLLDVIAQCGLEVGEVCSEYDEIVASDKKNLADTIARAVPSAENGLLRRVIWRLRAKTEPEEPGGLRFWLNGEPLQELDFIPENADDAAHRTIASLHKQVICAKLDIQRLEMTVLDRERDLERERYDAATRNAELVDRTDRLERALEQVEALRAQLRQSESGTKKAAKSGIIEL
jgi:hypothetical protein